METGLIIGGVIVLLLILLTRSRLRLRQSVPPATADTRVKATANERIGVDVSDRWWGRLDKENQLKLAVFLTGMTLPVWEKYIAAGNASYRDAASPGLTMIDRDLLNSSLQAVKSNTPEQRNNDQQQIDDCYKQFIGPVVALQDGDWVPPYAVKKIFLSCYNILKGVAESSKTGYSENFFAIAIDHSLDCIEIARLYDSEQVDQVLSPYKFMLR